MTEDPRKGEAKPPSDPRVLPTAKLEWPPSYADLRRLYVDEKRSAIEIAKIYGLRTKNPRSAPYLITYHLKRHGIERRNRVAELKKAASTSVIEWSSRHPPPGSSPADPTLEADAILELLRLPNLSIKHLDETTKRRVGGSLRFLHHEQGLSLTDIAGMLGGKTSGYASWVARQVGVEPREFEEARLKGIHEKVRKYERRPFDGTDVEKAYFLGLRHGDLHASRPWKDVVKISTSTTHPAMAELFISLFEKYGHVYLHPRYKKETDTYEWNLSANLDSSFEFFLMSNVECWDWVGAERSRILGYLAGLFDAEGTIGIYPNALNVALTVAFYNTNLELLNKVHGWLGRIGYHPLRPYLEKPKGTRSSGFKIVIKKDYWRVLVATFEESQSLLDSFGLRHGERIMKKAIALSIHKGDRWVSVQNRVQQYRKAVRTERDLFVAEAERLYLMTHKNPRETKSDPP